MKSNIHSQWQHDAVVTCSCGNTFTTGATQSSLTVDICSACHPFYTGEMKFVDRQKRVDKFLKKMELAQQKQQQRSQKKGGSQATESTEDPKSYQDILREQQQVLKQQARKAE